MPACSKGLLLLEQCVKLKCYAGEYRLVQRSSGKKGPGIPLTRYGGVELNATPAVGCLSTSLPEGPLVSSLNAKTEKDQMHARYASRRTYSLPNKHLRALQHAQ